MGAILPRAVPRALPRRLTRGDNPTRGRGFIVLGSALVCLLVIVPIVAMANETFTSSQGFDDLQRVAGRSAFIRSLLHSALLVAVALPVGTCLGLLLALLILRTDVPIGGRVARVLPLVSLIMPPLVGALGWVFMFTPNVGFVNLFFDRIGLPQFNIYSYTGVLVAASLYVVPYAYALCSTALESMDGRLEEAARMSGSGPIRTLLSVTVRTIKPAVTGAALIVGMAALSEFSIPLIIGNSFGFNVMTVEMYRAVRGRFPSDYVTASALGSILLIVALAGIAAQRRALRKGGYETVTGKGSPPVRVALGRWRYVAAVGVWGYIGLVVVLPTMGVLYVSLMRFWDATPALSSLSLNHYRRGLGDPVFQKAIGNSMILGLSTAVIVVLLGVVVGYMTTKLRHHRLSAPTDFLSMVPMGVPHMVLALGFLFLMVRLGGIYGSLFGLLIAYVAFYIPYSSRLSSAALRQLGNELEEAALMSGASPFTVLRTVVVPLVAPAMRIGGVLVFVLAFRELSASALLSTSGSVVVSRVLLDTWEYNTLSAVAALAGVVLVINLLMLLVVFTKWNKLVKPVIARLNRRRADPPAVQGV